jgi:outer membrane protein
MKMRKLLTIAFLMFAALINVHSQEIDNVWTLERCIEHANKNNLAIKISELKTEYAKKSYNQSYFNVLPDLGASIDHEFGSGRLLIIDSYEWENRKSQQGSVGIGSNLTLFNGLQNYNEIQESKFLFLKSKEDLEVLKNDITLSLAAYYLEVLFSEEMLEVAKSQYEVSSLQVERSKRLVEIGNSARSELYDIQAQAANDKLALTNAQTRLNLAVLDLTQILDLDSVGDFNVYRPELSVELINIPSSISDIYADARDERPEVKSAEYLVLAQKKKLAQAQGGRSPRVYLGGIYYSRYLKDAVHPLTGSAEYTYADQLKDNRYAQLSVGVDIPIFNKFQTQTNISHSRIILKEYDLMLEQSVQQLYKKIQQAYADALGAFENYNSAAEAVKSNEEAFNYAKERFEVGLVNSVDFNIAKNNLTKAKSDLVQAKYQYIFKVKMLEYYQGKPMQL